MRTSGGDAMSQKDFWLENRKLIYGILSGLFVLALLIHWNQNYKKTYQVDEQIDIDQQVELLLRVVKNYTDLYEIIKDPKNEPFILETIASFDPGSPYERWKQEQLPPSLQASLVRLSQAKIHLKTSQEAAKKQIRFRKDGIVIDEDLKNMTGVELSNAVKEALVAGNIIVTYKSENP